MTFVRPLTDIGKRLSDEDKNTLHATINSKIEELPEAPQSWPTFITNVLNQSPRVSPSLSSSILRNRVWNSPGSAWANFGNNFAKGFEKLGVETAQKAAKIIDVIRRRLALETSSNGDLEGTFSANGNSKESPPPADSRETLPPPSGDSIQIPASAPRPPPDNSIQTPPSAPPPSYNTRQPSPSSSPSPGDKIQSPPSPPTSDDESEENPADNENDNPKKPPSDDGESKKPSSEDKNSKGGPPSPQPRARTYASANSTQSQRGTAHASMRTATASANATGANASVFNASVQAANVNVNATATGVSANALNVSAEGISMSGSATATGASFNAGNVSGRAASASAHVGVHGLEANVGNVTTGAFNVSASADIGVTVSAFNASFTPFSISVDGNPFHVSFGNVGFGGITLTWPMPWNIFNLGGGAGGGSRSTESESAEVRPPTDQNNAGGSAATCSSTGQNNAGTFATPAGQTNTGASAIPTAQNNSGAPAAPNGQNNSGASATPPGQTNTKGSTASSQNNAGGNNNLIRNIIKSLETAQTRLSDRFPNIVFDSQGNCFENGTKIVDHKIKTNKNVPSPNDPMGPRSRKTPVPGSSDGKNECDPIGIPRNPDEARSVLETHYPKHPEFHETKSCAMWYRAVSNQLEDLHNVTGVNQQNLTTVFSQLLAEPDSIVLVSLEARGDHHFAVTGHGDDVMVTHAWQNSHQLRNEPPMSLSTFGEHMNTIRNPEALEKDRQHAAAALFHTEASREFSTQPVTITWMFRGRLGDPLVERPNTNRQAEGITRNFDQNMCNRRAAPPPTPLFTPQSEKHPPPKSNSTEPKHSSPSSDDDSDEPDKGPPYKSSSTEPKDSRSSPNNDSFEPTEQQPSSTLHAHDESTEPEIAEVVQEYFSGVENIAPADLQRACAYAMSPEGLAEQSTQEEDAEIPPTELCDFCRPKGRACCFQCLLGGSR